MLIIKRVPIITWVLNLHYIAHTSAYIHRVPIFAGGLLSQCNGMYLQCQHAHFHSTDEYVAVVKNNGVSYFKCVYIHIKDTGIDTHTACCIQVLEQTQHTLTHRERERERVCVYVRERERERENQHSLGGSTVQVATTVRPAGLVTNNS